MQPVFETLRVGDEVVNLLKPAITKDQLVRYAGASGDFNPLHTDDETAKASGFHGVIAHGMLVMGFLTQAVTTWIPKRLLRQIRVRFRGITRPGDRIVVTARIDEKRIEGSSGIVKCSIEAVDQNKDVKVSGTFEAVFPLPS